MQVTNLKLESNMKEELLEAIYGTVERLEQKVDELSVSTKNAGAENVPASNDITKLDKSINAMFTKEEEVRGKISKLRDAIVVFADLIKVELGKKEQRNKLLVDAVKQMKQEHTVTSKALQEKLEVMNKSPQKKVVTHRFEPTSKNVLLFIGGLALSLVISIWGNLTQWREHQDWEEADLKYRALKMVLPSDDPNIRYIEKHFNVQRDEDVIYKLRTRVDVYEDSVYQEITRRNSLRRPVPGQLSSYPFRTPGILPASNASLKHYRAAFRNMSPVVFNLHLPPVPCHRLQHPPSIRDIYRTV